MKVSQCAKRANGAFNQKAKKNLDQLKLVNFQVHHFLGYSFNTITLDYNFVTCLDRKCLREDAGISKDKPSKSFAKD